MRRVDVAFGVRFGNSAQKALQLGEGRKLAGVDKRRGWNVLGDVRRTAVNRNAAGVEAVEELFGNVPSEACVVEHEREPVAGQEAQLVFDRAAVDVLRRVMQRRVYRRVPLVPAFAIEVELVRVCKGFDGA